MIDQVKFCQILFCKKSLLKQSLGVVFKLVVHCLKHANLNRILGDLLGKVIFFNSQNWFNCSKEHQTPKYIPQIFAH